MTNLTHLHLHTSYSFLDGFNSPAEAAKRAKELGMTHLAITDHNHVGGVLEFQKACEKEGITPMLGCEMYWTWDMDIASLPIDERTELAIEKAKEDGMELPEKMKKTQMKELLSPYQYDMKQYHIILIAINQTGWKNLVKIQSEAAARCTYNGRYLCDNNLLRENSEGLVMTTACISNAAAAKFINKEDDKAHEILNEWKDIFGDRFFVEIQPLNISKQHISNLKMLSWAIRNDVKVVATTDVHYTLKSDHDDHDTLLCIGIGKSKDEKERMTYSNDFWLKSYDEMLETFQEQVEDMSPEIDKEEYMKEVVKALENTNLIAQMVEPIKLGADKPVFPKIEIPNNLTPEQYLTLKCYQNLYKYKKENPEIDLRTYERRIQEELNVINPKGFAPYMLIVEEYINWANENNCPTGPGRGSAAGSLVLFLLGVTKIIDPIKYNLLFFRFLTKDRTSPPDVDTDFEYYNRHKVIEHLEELYGANCVAHIGTYTYMGVKSGLKDVGRVLCIDFATMNQISKSIDTILDQPSVKFKDFDKLKESSEPSDISKWKDFNKLENDNKELFRLARRFEGTPRNMGVHASGILITPDPISEILPTRTDKNGTTVTLYTGVQLEDLNYIKFDILGLKTLSVIKNTLEHIDKSLKIEDLYKMMDPNDPEMYEMVKRKETDGLFQIESNLFKGMIEEIQPDSLNDIIVLNSLGRPGPLSAGMDKAYARRKHGMEEAVEPLKNTWDIVESTLGTIAYQEQIMLIAQRVAGFDGNQADSYLRKALAKKAKDKMELCRRWLIYGKINEEAPEDYNEDDINQVMYDPSRKYGSPIKGGISKGYDEKDLVAFWESLKGYADYLFNLSHAACYSFITAMTNYLKRYYPVEFMAALLSAEENEEKMEKYVKVAENMNISVQVPDINLSGKDFTPMENKILYGLNSIKGVGETSIPAILENRPYENIGEAIEKIGKKSFNKRVGIALIKSGAFDFIDKNRFALINSFYDIRKDKDDRLDMDDYDEGACIKFEKEVLGAPVTFKPWWDSIDTDEKIIRTFEIVEVEERYDKNRNLMGFVTLLNDGCLIRGIAFSRVYAKNVGNLDTKRNKLITVSGKKDSKGILIINKISPYKEENTGESVVNRILA